MENVEATSHPKVRKLRNNRFNGSGDLVAELHAIYREAAGDSSRLKAWLVAKIPEYRHGQGR
jgi:hypothetical protein